MGLSQVSWPGGKVNFNTKDESNGLSFFCENLDRNANCPHLSGFQNLTSVFHCCG